MGISNRGVSGDGGEKAVERTIDVQGEVEEVGGIGVHPPFGAAASSFGVTALPNT